LPADFEKNNSTNAINYQHAYQFILIFLLALSVTQLINKILLNYFPPGWANSVLSSVSIGCLFITRVEILYIPWLFDNVCIYPIDGGIVSVAYSFVLHITLDHIEQT